MRQMLASSVIVACTDGKLQILEPHPQGGGGGSSGVAAQAGAGGSAGFAGQSAGGGNAGISGTSPFVLDDFEDGDTQSLNIPEGYWYFQPDGTCSGSFGIEVTSGSSGSTHAIRARGGGCTDWGALLGLDLGGTGQTFDASSFDALRFWARAEPGSHAELSVSLLDPVHFDTAITLTSEWQEFVLPLDDFVFNDDG